MALNKALSQELEQEFASTRKMLQSVPEEHFAWKPHERSYTLGRLASHVAELTGWVSFILTTNELDFEKGDYTPVNAATSAELMELFEKNFASSKEELQKANDDVLMQHWKFRNGEQIYFDLPKIAVLRSFAMNHIIHHRAQLSVYLRLLNIPVPGMYGPTADERM
ncbi:MAG TPA: DinB family protein [Chitinophagaceae bacterium]|nr:DinB family protein [Chitinophagaceae bacterium]